MIPLHDDNPTRRRPYVKYLLIAACTLVFGLQQVMTPPQEQAVFYIFGLVPAVLIGAADFPPALTVMPESLAMVTAMFLHGGWMHFLGNMAFLFVFGDNVEDAMTRPRFVVFYLLCGLAAAGAHVASEPTSTLPMIGASGAIAGVLGAYLLLHPRARVLTLIPLGPIFFWKRLPAGLLLAVWFGLQFLYYALQGEGEGGVAYMAHIGGFVTGLILILLFKRRDVPLFAGRTAIAEPAPAPGLFRAPPGRTRLPGAGRPNRKGPWG